jgi:hypothetical protein
VDKRRAALDREERIREYCTACKRWWRRKPLSELPEKWALGRNRTEQLEKEANLKTPFYPRANSEPQHFQSLSATDETHGQIQDLGPTYQAPLFHDAKNNEPDGAGGIGSGIARITLAGPGPYNPPKVAFPRDTAVGDEEDFQRRSLGGPSGTGTAKSRNSALSAAEGRRERQSRGLRRGAPRFSVNPDGTLNDG